MVEAACSEVLTMGRLIEIANKYTIGEETICSKVPTAQDKGKANVEPSRKKDRSDSNDSDNMQHIH